MTIHRLLGFNGQEKDEETEREVVGRLIIIDEMSMVDMACSSVVEGAS